MRKILAVLLAMLVSSPAWAGSSTVGVTAGSGTNVSVTTDGSSNVFWRNTIWDYAAGANGAAVNTSHQLSVSVDGSTVGATTGATSSGALGSLVNCASTTSQSGTANGTQNYVNCTTNGAVRTDINSVAGTSLGAPSNFGTSPGAVAVPGVNASMMQGTTAVAAEPCQTGTKTFTPINGITTATSTRIITNAGSKVVTICHVFLNTSVAEAVSIVSTTTGGCAGAAAMIGDATADSTHGVQLAANQGFSLGNGGYGIAQTASNKDICVVTGSTGTVNGSIVTVQQ